MNNTRETLINTLLNDNSYHIEFNGHLTNHNKHAVVALSRLGASQKRIKSYYQSYAAETPYGYALEPARNSKHIITNDNWKLYLGKRTSFSSYCDFFSQKEQELGMKQLLREYIPILISGWVGSLSHGTIHLGWALDINNRFMAIEGLAYMAFSYVSCNENRAFSDESSNLIHNSAVDSFIHIADVWEKNPDVLQTWVEKVITEKESKIAKNIHPELLRSGLQYRIAKLLGTGHPLIYNTPAWLYNQDIKATWQDLYYIVTLLYVAKPGDFVILHLITALHAMEHIAKYMPLEQQKHTIKCFWIGMLCILFSFGEFPQKTLLKALHLQYKDSKDDNITTSKQIKNSWQQIIDNAIAEREEHNHKMVYVLKRLWELYGQRSIFRIAANNFTTTPKLPKSFEMPPTK